MLKQFGDNNEEVKHILFPNTSYIDARLLCEPCRLEKKTNI